MRTGGRLRLTGLAFLAAVQSGLPWGALAAPPGFQNEVLIGGLSEPTGLGFTPDGRMLIIERGGIIRVVQPGAVSVDAQPLLQLTNINTANGERGLVGIALDPVFASNGYYYVFYTANSPLVDRVSRFTATGNTTVPASEFVVWEDNVTAGSFHHGGTVAFGPDGLVYVSTGDHFSAADSQSLQSYHGKILRLRPDGTVPGDNPFIDGAGPNLDAIWARGLRNPFRFAFDPISGRMYIADVGANDASTSIEEVNLGAAGANYGWPVCEGSCGTAGMTSPIYSYPHAGRDASISGGFVYRGSQFPPEYQGTYFFGDYVLNWIRRLTFDAGGSVTGALAFEPETGASDGPYGEIVDLKQGPDGALYYVDFGVSWEGASNPGIVRRIRYTLGNQPPSAQAAALPTGGPAPLSVAFTSAGSGDPEGQPLGYQWDFGDNTSSAEANPTHLYLQNGRYSVRLTVSDGVSSAVSAPLSISVGSPPIATIVGPASGLPFRAGDTIFFSGSAFDPDGTLALGAFSWTVLFHHDTHTHPFLGPLSGVSDGSFAIERSGHDYSGDTRYEIVLVVTDADGLQGTASVFVLPEKVNLTVDTQPSGLTVQWDGVSLATPFVRDSLIGFEHTANAPDQSAGGTSYAFVGWSDGGARSHLVVTPAAPQSYLASYQAGATLPAGLLAGYGLNEGAGPTASDASGNGLTASVSGATWTTSGQFGGALSFDGVNDLATTSAATLGSAFTLTAWVFNPTNTAWETLLAIGATRDLYLAGGVLSFYDGASDRAFGAAIPTNSWQHVALSYDGATLRAYLNGAPRGNALAATLAPVSAGIRIGSWIFNGSNTDFFGGRIDEVQIYGRALSAAEIAQAMSTPVGAPAADTEAPVLSNGQPSGTLPAGTTQAVLSVTTSEPATCRYATTPGVGYAAMTASFGATGGTSHTTAIAGLTAGGGYSFYVRCQDGAGNANGSDFSVVFSVAAPPPPDSIPPLRTSGLPAGTLPYGTTQVTLSLATDEAAVCRYGALPGVEYGALPGAFVTSGGTGHTTPVAGLVDGGSYLFYVRCEDSLGNANPDDFAIAFSVALPPPPDITPPLRTNGSPAGTLPSGTTAATLSLATDEAATCRYGSTPGVAYSLLAGAFTISGGASHSTLVGGLANGASYAFYVRCLDGSGNANEDDFPIGFAVASAPSGAPLAAYSFNQGSGGSAPDASGNGRTATLFGPTWSTLGRFAGALSFDAQNDRAAAPSVPLGPAFTLMAWVFNPSRSAYETIVTVGPERDLFLRSGRIGFYVGASEPLFGNAISNNTWHHVAIVYDGVRLTAYLNGALRGTPFTVPLAGTSGVLQIGAWPYGATSSDFFGGRIDEVRVYDRALTPAQIQADMNAPIAP